ncbi:MAG: DPP IV N-terminal domain-containing protein [Phycisphaerales bacterium]
MRPTATIEALVRGTALTGGLAAAALAVACAGTLDMVPTGATGIRAAAPSQPRDLRTTAERTDFRETSGLADVQGFLAALKERSPLVKLSELGKSGEGRAIPLALIADPPVSTPEQARESGKLLVLLVGGIHSGECDGKEGLLALAHELALKGRPAEGAEGESAKASHPLLKDLVVAIVPVYNVDGNEKVGDAARLRPGQAGPERVGTRENAAGLDLNRDFVKLEAPETRALVAFMNEWDPAIVVDTHTTNGSLHRYLLTYDGPKNPAGDRGIVEYTRDSFLPAVAAQVREKAGFDTFWYGNFERDHTRWETYPDQPRYGINYVGMRGRIGILTESYSYAPFKDRTRAQVEFVRACLERAASDREAIAELVQAADRRAESGRDATIAIRSRMVAAPERAVILGFEEELQGRRPVPKGEKEYEVDLFTRFEAEKTVPRPHAYVYPSSLTAVTETLQRHGIRVEEMREDIELDLSSLTIESLSRAVRPFQGHELATIRGTDAEASRRVPAGSMLVRTAQPLGQLAAYLLEPEAGDGLATWNFFDADLKQGGEFPVARVPGPAAILAAEAAPLPEKREAPRRLSFEEAYGSDRTPNLNGSPLGGLSWLEDGEHYLQSREGRTLKVHAATGRSEPFQDTAKIAAALRELPTIDRRTADSIARRPGMRTDKARTVGVFEHQNDLYMVKFDGSSAARLTSTPGREEIPTLSPDAAFVAFIRDNDLWVVDLQTQTERALTQGGHDRLRNGKNDWVYFEELFNRSWQAFWWSPDSSRLAYLQLDDEPVKDFAIVNGPARGDQRVEMTPYPKPGEPNPRVKLFTVPAAGGDPSEVDLSAYTPEDMLITGVGWWPDSSRVYAYVQNRVQSWLDIVHAPPDGGEARKLLRETTKAWVDAPPALRFLKDGSFLLMSERTGWKHIYRYSPEGELLRAITEGEWEARSIAHVDEEGGRLFVSGTLDTHIADNLYSVPLGGGEPTRLTTERGGHRADVSPSAGYFIDSWSSSEQRPRVALRDARDGSLIRMLDTNPVRDLARYRVAPTELFTITTDDGFVLEASLLKPTDFDPSRRYPVWYMTYGGPHAPQVSDSWGGGRLWDQVLAASGIVVFRCDPRSASGKGAVSAWAAYKQLGVPELRDIETAIRWVGAQPWADAARVGMSGHSYGGFMTSYCLARSTLFAAGIAGAPVTDWRDYDSIYTERFMLTPQENPEGYKVTSVVGAARTLHGRLLLVHGMIDDNVHLENATRLARALQQAGKQFEMMFYPDARHGVGGRHYQRLQYEFITRTMGVERSLSPETRAEAAPPTEREGGRPERRRRRDGP